MFYCIFFLNEYSFVQHKRLKKLYQPAIFWMVVYMLLADNFLSEELANPGKM